MWKCIRFIEPYRVSLSNGCCPFYLLPGLPLPNAVFGTKAASLALVSDNKHLLPSDDICARFLLSACMCTRRLNSCFRFKASLGSALLYSLQFFIHKVPKNIRAIVCYLASFIVLGWSDSLNFGPCVLPLLYSSPSSAALGNRPGLAISQF